MLEGYPHGYGTGSRPDVWGDAFDAFLTRVMAGSGTGIGKASQQEADVQDTQVYRTDGSRVAKDTTEHGIYIVKRGKQTKKIMK